MKQCLTVLAIVCAVGCAPVPPERKAIDDAAAVAGTVGWKARGDAPNVGQNTMPDGELPNWKVTEFKRTIDLANHRACARSSSAPRSSCSRTRTRSARIRASTATSRSTSCPRARPRVRRRTRRDRRMEMLQHPLVIVRMAFDDPATKLSGSPSAGKPAGRRRDDGERRHSHAGDRRLDQAAVARHVDERQRQPWATWPSRPRSPATRRERAEAAEAHDDEHRQVPAVRPAGLEEHRR